MYFRRFPRLLISALCLIGMPLVGRCQFAWQLLKRDGRDYLTLQNIAQFYQLQGDLTEASNHISLYGPRASIETTDDSRELIVNGVRQWLSFPVLVEGNQVLISRFDLAKTLEPTLRPNMIAGLHPFKTVVLDAGHGGVDRGARSTVGFEKDYTLDVIMDLKKLLQDRGFKVRLTREDDVFVPLENRAAQSNEEKDAIFVSVHFNSSTGMSANGFEVFATSPRGAASTGDKQVSLDQFLQQPGNEVDDASLALATCVQHSLLGHIPQPDRGVKRARFVVLKLCKLPSVLIEGGFLTNPGDSQQIDQAVWRERLAEAIAIGVQNFQALSSKRALPRLLADYRLEQLPTAGKMVDPTVRPVGPPSQIPASNQVDRAATPAPAPAN